jgi:hypothetical protein
MANQKIMDLIPESLHEKLIEEVKEILFEKQKEEADEISPEMKQYLKEKKLETKASATEIEKIINHIM